ncbi:GNAT family N-acetyltransferase [Streptomyces sp. HNM0574]|uniref:GNAT family N-acetyltransferase n=1 Tax=Streptomyces sp. HNM0574 TaxID=2714954 RepID=UPI00146DEE15|nr:GNAT family N-acetyltransferase [Streptomyces sp. HNM0574]NLU70020.1 GNAT family N-acetyltransferase [Streptomyces sp. HNM0574]
MRIRPVRYDHPDALKLDGIVQQEYAELYGNDGDATPLAPAMFAPPHGLYLLAHDETGRPVGTGGWRAQDDTSEGYEEGDAEIKRMFVVREARGRGLARRILALLEDDARRAGRTRMVLETGARQQEAITLYESSGYVPAPRKFGLYRFEALSRCYTKPLRQPAQAPPPQPPAR